ncbi:hypothetical protein FHG87_009680 [Trinorchestia longiramus]|nr:hypothetical protein FHG87_009680 [Trinorchestia longiramus]
MNFCRTSLVSTIRLMTLLVVFVLVTMVSARHSPPRDYTIDWPIKSYRSSTKLFDPRAYYASLYKVTKRTAEPFYVPDIVDAKSDVWRQQREEEDDFNEDDADQRLLRFTSFITLM